LAKKEEGKTPKRGGGVFDDRTVTTANNDSVISAPCARPLNTAAPKSTPSSITAKDMIG
jgi:hypothetical protein